MYTIRNENGVWNIYQMVRNPLYPHQSYIANVERKIGHSPDRLSAQRAVDSLKKMRAL